MTGQVGSGRPRTPRPSHHPAGALWACADMGPQHGGEATLKMAAQDRPRGRVGHSQDGGADTLKMVPA